VDEADEDDENQIIHKIKMKKIMLILELKTTHMVQHEMKKTQIDDKII
jgi:hypothetical protein